MSQVSITAGRILLGLYFLLPGLMKVAAPAQTIAYMESHNIAFAEPLMWFAAAANIIGGLLLIAGRHVKLVAYGCVVYILLVNVLLHGFWGVTENVVERETQNFIKNLGILAGLLVLAGFSPARSLSSAGWWRSDKAVTG
ncbi:DoxX family protein [Erythrobacter sp. F6033]|uniref:DoxX family protein n=1 Tax=Erythrobacter sp. F6033 TaxID=2926401 RepID=UPI001FF43B1E|nr:DoxX family protein [Erythrobacter sp. F6033]MCK0128866.1 DoxX family protein [Erythrobacter sp. F6033]